MPATEPTRSQPLPAAAGNTVFVTGGAGLIGSALLKQLLNEGATIRALYRSSMPVTLSADEQSRIEWIKGDVLDTSLLDEALNGCKQVYHCAAVVSFHPARRVQMYKINIEGTANVVNAALANSVQKLVHVSSVAALGRFRKNEVVTEKSEWSEETNNSHYGKTKYLSELEVWRGISEGLPAAIVNPTIVLGESKWDTGSTAIFKKVWEEFPWYTNGGTGFVDAADVATAMVKLMNSDISGERFILSHVNTGYRQLFEMIAAAFGKRPPHKKGSAWMMELAWRLEAAKAMLSNSEPLITKETVKTSQATTVYDSSKLLQTIPGFSYTPLDTTVQRTSQWLKEFYQLK